MYPLNKNKLLCIYRNKMNKEVLLTITDAKVSPYWKVNLNPNKTTGLCKTFNFIKPNNKTC